MKKIIFAALAVLALASCNKEHNTTTPTNEANQVSIKFTKGTDTRAFFDPSSGAEAWEKTLNNVSVFVFKADGNLVLRRDMTPNEVSGNRVKFSLPWSASDQQLRFYAIANFANTSGITTEAAIKALLDVDAGVYNGTTNDVFTKAKRAEGFTMSAVKEVQFANSANTTTEVEMTLRRTVAKVAMRVTVDDVFAQRYDGAGIKITNVTVLNSEKNTAIIAPTSIAAGLLNQTLSQAPNVNGKDYESLFYIFDNGNRAADKMVTLKIDALFDLDGNFATTTDQSVVSYTVKLNSADSGIVKRNSYYRISASLKGLDGHDINVTVKVADWDGPIDQSENLGN